ncbi:MAG: hypothetical protein Kow0031_12040 [Anaerolineae bacterium]
MTEPNTDPIEPTEAEKAAARERQWELTQQIAAALNESGKTPLQTLNRVVYVLGEERALALLAEAQRVEADGGMLTDDGQQRRTPGGTYFKLVKEKVNGQERGRIFTPPKAKPKAKLKLEPPAWEILKPLAEEFLAQNNPGEGDKVKLTLIGRPGKVIEKEAVVMTTMQSNKAPSLPKGLPALPPKPTTYLVFIAHKQWRKVSEAIAADPADKLIIEGYPAFDARIGGGTMCLYAQSVTTTTLQRAKWADKPAEVKQ